jgi:hypothetical protein
LRMNSSYLRSCLPPGSRNFFTPRRYGNHLGVPCVCHCGAKPPKHIAPWNRWRWLSFHVSVVHALKHVEQVGEESDPFTPSPGPGR